MRSRLLVLTGVLGCAFVGTRPLHAQGIVQSACMDALTAQVKGKEKGVSRVERIGDASQLASTPGMMQLSGKGHFERKKGDWTPIDYTCTFDTRTSKVTATSYQVTQNAPGEIAPPAPAPGGADRPLDTSKPWASQCQTAVRNKITYETNATNIKFYDASQREFDKSDVEVGVRGQGEGKRRDGKLQKFMFSCAWDRRTAQVTSVEYRSQ